MRRIDISMPLRTGMAAFPGDPLFRATPTHSLAHGDPYNVSSLSFGSHAGTHVDPPLHFFSDGLPIDRIDLDILNGPCVVVGVDPRCAEIGPSEVARVPAGFDRVLFRTANSDRWGSGASFFPDYVALTLPAAEALVTRGVRLLGIDSLSVESDPSGKYPVHHQLLGHGSLILEGLNLAGVAPGKFVLECLPLRLEGGDGGPARAILIAP
ncbi:MAG: cyclase family protein [Thermoplasmata archaeon]